MGKLNMQELVGLLAQQSGWTKKDSEELLKEFLTGIVEGLEKEEQVKIKGLGTFKRVWNAPRKSVNIKTGEEFEIEGHYKISFAPENDLKQLINQPYSHLEATSLDESETAGGERQEEDSQNLNRLSDHAEELLAIISEIRKQEPREDLPAQPEQPAQPEPEAEKPVNAEPIVPIAIETVPTEKEEPKPEEPEKEPETVGEKCPCKCRTGCAWTAVAGVLLLTGLLVYYFLFAPFEIQIRVVDKQPQAEEYFYPIEQEELEQPADSLSADTITAVRDTLRETPKDTIVQPVTQPKEPEYLDEIVFGRGDRLELLALKYYGSKLFWVYIYEANKTKIKNPDNVHLGTKLKIPKLDAELINPNNPESITKAKELSKEFLK